MKKIIYINADYRNAQYKKNGDKQELIQQTVKPILQVYKTTLKNYKVGDYLHLSLERQPYAVGKVLFSHKILFLKEEVLAKVFAVNDSVIYVDIVKE